MKKPVVLCILDGVGLSDSDYGNALHQADTKFLDSLWKKYPHSKLDASGEAVGLPAGTMGNSEVGHMNIGAGKIVYQPSQFINASIKDGSFYNNTNLNNIISLAKHKGSALHIIGLISDAGVHSLLGHLFAILDMAKSSGIEKLYIHGLSDGRDTPQKSGLDFFNRVNDKLEEIGIGKIATVGGRYYGMDRDNRWDRVLKAYNAMVCGIGNKYSSYKEAILDSYDRGITDEFIEPCIIDEEGLIKDGDVVIDFNFRPDRLRELLYALSNPDFKEFDRKYINIDLLTLMPVSSDVICTNAFTNQKVDTPLGVVLANSSKTQLRIAETEKYAHVTYFFDGGIDKEYQGEKRILVPSPKVATYDLEPEMSAHMITASLVKEITTSHEDLIILNFANGDMVGHTGDYEAAIKAVETVDECIGKILENISLEEYTIIVTADHGNCEVMRNKDNSINTSHTTNVVPFIITDKSLKLIDGKLGDIAPTILTLMGLEVPSEMTGNILIKSRKKR